MLNELSSILVLVFRRRVDSPTMLQRRIVATDRQIDALLYELYGLAEEEAAPGVPYAIVEGTSG